MDFVNWMFHGFSDFSIFAKITFPRNFGNIEVVRGPSVYFF